MTPTNATPPPPTAASTNQLTSAKIVIAEGSGAAGTTAAFVSAICAVARLRTESTVGAGEVAGGAMPVDVGRIDVDEALILYLFGAPGQVHARPEWDELCDGAVGVVILADPYRAGEHAAAAAYADSRRLPYVVALPHPDRDTVDARRTLRLAGHVPVLACDVRDRSHVLRTLIALVEQALGLPHSNTPIAPATG
jgi:signal recognition particle receptor subunit beta